MSHRRLCQTSMLVFRASRSTLVTKASNQTMSAQRSGGRPKAGGRIEAQRAGQEVQPHVDAAAPLEQFPDLRVGLGGRQARVEVEEHDLGYEQPEGASDLARDEFGDEGLLAVAGAAELGHVEAVVVGLDDSRQRAALAQRGHVAGRGDASDHAVKYRRRRAAAQGERRPAGGDCRRAAPTGRSGREPPPRPRPPAGPPSPPGAGRCGGPARPTRGTR